MSIKLCENINRLREEKGITQGELANVLTVTPQSVSRWEKGFAYPDIEKLPQLASYFDVTIDELIGAPEPTLHSISRELVQIRMELGQQKTPEKMLKYLDLLEKSVNIGSNIYLTEYISTSEKLKNEWNYISTERADSIYETVKGKLLQMSPSDRQRKLLSILINEDEAKMTRWSDLVTDDSTYATWNDYMMNRYWQRGEIDKYEKIRVQSSFDEISKLLYTLTQKSAFNTSDNGNHLSESVENCLLAKSLIDVFSKRDDDIFLFVRIVVESRLLISNLSIRNIDKVRHSLSYLKQLINTYKSLRGGVLNGSVDLFADFQIPCNDTAFDRALFDLDIFLWSDEFIDFKNSDAQALEFSEFVEKLHAEEDPFYCIKDRESFIKLYNLASEKTKSVNSEDLNYVFAAETASGNIYVEIIDDCYNESESERAFKEKLKHNNDTHVIRLVGLLCGSVNCVGLDLPSCRFSEALCDLDLRNLKTNILLKSFHAYTIKQLEVILPPSIMLKYESKNR